MTSILSLLSAGISSTLQRHSGIDAPQFTEFPKLKAAEQLLARTMEKVRRRWCLLSKKDCRLFGRYANSRC